MGNENPETKIPEEVTSNEKSVVLSDGNHSTGNAIAKAGPTNSILTVINFESQEIPDDSETELVPLDLASEYWSPEGSGETKNLLFSHFDVSLVPDKYGPNKNVEGALVPLETAFFYQKNADGTIVTIRQASKVLVGDLKRNNVQPGTLLTIVHKGKTKFNNGNTGDTWGVFPRKILVKN